MALILAAALFAAVMPLSIAYNAVKRRAAV